MDAIACPFMYAYPTAMRQSMNSNANLQGLPRLWELPAAFVIAMGIFGFLQFIGPGLAGNDGYYHIAMGSLIRDEGLRVAFPYLEFTLLDTAHYVDMHLLFHLLQSPFTAFLTLDHAARLSVTVFATMTCTLFVYLLKRYDIPHPLFWLLILIASSATFLYRMSMPRPPVFALAYTLLAFHCLMQRNVRLLALTALLFTWTYKVFPILIPLTLFGMAACYAEDRKLDFKPLAAVCIGMAAGLIINPYFPDNIGFLWDAIRMKILSDGFGTHVGNEWYPYNSLHLLKIIYLPLAAWICGLLLTNRDEWQRDPARLFWFLTSSMWLILLLKSRRFIEFFPPAAILFLAFSVRSYLHHAVETRFWQQYKLLSVAILLLLGGISYHTMHQASHTMMHRASVNAYRGAAQWLITHTSKGSRIFNTDWDDFPRLFFHDRHNTYIVGLDPDYMRLKNAKLYKLWRNISKGRVKHPEGALLNTFDTRYVFTDTHHKGFIHMAKRNHRLKKVYSDKNTIVYQVLTKDHGASHLLVKPSNARARPEGRALVEEKT